MGFVFEERCFFFFLEINIKELNEFIYWFGCLFVFIIVFMFLE